MELGSGLGGIALIVLAAVWLLVFVPGWAKKAQISANPELVKNILPDAAAGALNSSTQLERLMRTRRTFSLALFSALVVLAAWFAVPTISSLGIWIAISATAVSVMALAMLVAANQTKRRIAVKRIEARNSVRERIQHALPTNSESSPSPTAVSKETGWDPNPLPSPLSAPKVGALITPKVADVIPIKAQEENSEQKVSRPTIELDEILRRRRVI